MVTPPGPGQGAGRGMATDLTSFVPAVPWGPSASWAASVPLERCGDFVLPPTAGPSLQLPNPTPSVQAPWDAWPRSLCTILGWVVRVSQASGAPDSLRASPLLGFSPGLCPFQAPSRGRRSQN